MDTLEEKIAKDVERIQALDIVPSILDLICRTTGMGFTAVARVTESRWIACAVQDEIGFGLKPGGELKLETTICNEIKDHNQPVVIDEVSCDEQFKNHHTPAMYGFQSYISIPIFLKNGTFFGTLCAIDPKPRQLKSAGMVNMFKLFADLISYHLLTLDQFKATAKLLQNTESKLNASLDDIRQYSFISHHTFQEPLRKLQLYTEKISSDETLPQDHDVKKLAFKVNDLAKDFSFMIGQVSTYSDMSISKEPYEAVDLNGIIKIVLEQLQLKIIKSGARIAVSELPVVPGFANQIGQLFYFLLDNALNFTRPGVVPSITIYSTEVDENDLATIDLSPQVSYCKICISDNGIGIDNSQLSTIFDLFSKLNRREKFEGLGMGLSQSKRIIKNHKGGIHVRSQVDVGSEFILILPLN